MHDARRIDLVLSSIFYKYYSIGFVKTFLLLFLTDLRDLRVKYTWTQNVSFFVRLLVHDKNFLLLSISRTNAQNSLKVLYLVRPRYMFDVNCPKVDAVMQHFSRFLH